MDIFWEIVASNALVATALAVGTVILSRVLKNPAILHLLWVIVLLKLLVPPLVKAPLPFAIKGWQTAVGAHSVDQGTVALALEADPSTAPSTLTPSESPSLSGKTNNRPQGTFSWFRGIGAGSLSTLLAAAWAFGSCCVFLRYAFFLRRFARLLSDSEPASPAISRMVAQSASQFGLRRIPQVLMTAHALPPLVWSLGTRPRLVLPSPLFARLSEKAQAMIIAHEMAHISRRDYLVRLLELAAKILFWWHPVVWWACSQLHDLEEQCCDSRVMDLVPQQAKTYATALVDTLEFLSKSPRVFVPLPTAVHSTGSLSRRIRMLTHNRTSRLSTLSAASVLAMVAIPLTIVFAGDAATDTFLSGRVTNEAGEPLDDALVRVAIPATDMRYVDSNSDHKRLETLSNANGEYRLELSRIAKPTTVSLDVMKPGYSRSVGTLMGSGDVREVKIVPNSIAEASFTLKPSLYLKGVVVDENGKSIVAARVSSTALYAQALGYVEMTTSNVDGSFELFNYPAKPFGRGDDIAKGKVGFSHPDYIRNEIEDIYTLTQDQRESLRVVLSTGRIISGTVLDVAGNPVPKVMVKAIAAEGGHLKTTMTNRNGKFTLRALAESPTALRVHAFDLKQKIKLPVDLDSDKNNLEVHLQAISLSTEPVSVDVLGMQLTDMNPELQAVYDRYLDQGALILDPGKNFERLEIGHLAEGCNFWIVGEERVGSVREFVQQILTEAASQETKECSVRVVYHYSYVWGDGSNTQYLKLTQDDLEQLRKVLAQLSEN